MCGRALLAAASVAMAVALALPARALADAAAGEDLEVGRCRLVSIEERPYLLSLQRKDKGHVCDASLVARPWLLTAAHCLYDRTQLASPLNYFVVGGITDLTGCFFNLIACIETEGAQIGQPKRFVVSPDYDFSRMVGNDLAMIKLRRKLNLGKRVDIVKLPTTALHSSTLNNQTICSASWWLRELRPQRAGAVADVVSAARAQRQLCAVQLPLLDVAACAQLLGRHLPPREHLCTSAPALDDSCRNDAGSPLVCNGIQVGVFSSERPGKLKECNESDPGVYARVDTHVIWLHEVMAAAPPLPRACLCCTLCLLCGINCLFP